MPTNPLTAIWHRLGRNPPVFFEDQLDSALGGSREHVFRSGLLREDRPSGSAACRDCENGSVGRVEWLDRTRTGRRDAYIRCPRCGPVPIDPDSLRQWAIDLQTLLAAVRDAGKFRGNVTEVVPGHVWHLGNATWCGRARQVYFLRCIHEGVRATVVAAIASHPKAILLFPTEEAAHKWGAATENALVALESVVGLGPHGITFDAELVEGQLIDAGSADGPKQKPIPKRATRAANIARLTEALVEFLREAREHACGIQRLTGTPELLPRPSRTQLAEEVGLSKADVTKCFDDETARELNLYWEMALDLDAVMKFKGPISTGPNA
jgi:hypothetical protein